MVFILGFDDWAIMIVFENISRKLDVLKNKSLNLLIFKGKYINSWTNSKKNKFINIIF